MAFYIGIDLHGTLLRSKEEDIPERLAEPLRQALLRLKNKAKIFLCTGNDLGFVKRKISSDLLCLCDGFVLETGCVISSGENEIVLVNKEIVGKIKHLESILKQRNFPEVYKFARRLATISMFTKFGIRPEEFFPRIQEAIRDLEFDDIVRVTYSSVAVDIIPRGFNKFTGMKKVAEGNKIIGIADSMNDIELIEQSDFGFIPRNASEKVVERLKSSGKVLQGFGRETKGLIEILNFLNEF